MSVYGCSWREHDTKCSCILNFQLFPRWLGSSSIRIVCRKVLFLYERIVQTKTSNTNQKLQEKIFVGRWLKSSFFFSVHCFFFPVLNLVIQHCFLFYPVTMFVDVPNVLQVCSAVYHLLARLAPQVASQRQRRNDFNRTFLNNKKKKPIFILSTEILSIEHRCALMKIHNCLLVRHFEMRIDD